MAFLPTLPPTKQMIGVFPEQVATRCETIVLKEKIMSLSGDSFDVKLANGQPLFQVKGQFFSISGRKQLYDMHGKHLFDIRKEHLHLHATYVLCDPQGKKFFEIRNRIKLFGSKATATFTSATTGRTESLTMKGNWIDTRAEIVDDTDGSTVALIDRQLLNARELFFAQQTYALVVAPGVDMALLVGMCICLDEHKNEGH